MKLNELKPGRCFRYVNHDSEMVKDKIFVLLTYQYDIQELNGDTALTELSPSQQEVEYVNVVEAPMTFRKLRTSFY